MPARHVGPLHASGRVRLLRPCSGILILAMIAVLGAEIQPEALVDAMVGELANARRRCTVRLFDFVSESQTEAVAPGGS